MTCPPELLDVVCQSKQESVQSFYVTAQCLIRPDSAVYMSHLHLLPYNLD